MDIFAFASKTETQGMVLTEAMASGKPIVALDAPGAREVVIDGYNGKLLLNDDVTQFVVALETLAAFPTRKREKFRDAALATAKQFSMPNSAAKCLNVYKGLIRKKVKRPRISRWQKFSRSMHTEWGLCLNVLRSVRKTLAHEPKKNTKSYSLIK